MCIKTGHDMPAGLASLTQFLCCASHNSARRREGSGGRDVGEERRGEGGVEEVRRGEKWEGGEVFTGYSPTAIVPSHGSDC